MRISCTIAVFLLLQGWVAAQSLPLKVSDNKRMLVYQEGSPFYWIGDTAWELFHRLDREEAGAYLGKRARQGFTVIQAVILAELDGLNTPNPYGDLPLVEKNPLIPNEAYFEHVDYVVQKAGQLGLQMAILPSWGEWVTPRFGEFIFKNEQDSYTFGNYLGKRYADSPHIIWVLGGDRLPDEREEGLSIWNAMAEGITDGVNGDNEKNGKANYQNTLMTYHCFAPSTDFFSDTSWVDFHSWGSYHNPAEESRAFTVAKPMREITDLPIINLEPAYEEIPRNYYADARLGYFDDYEIRKQAYWSVFAGAFGHTYGAHPVWQMYNQGIGPRSTYTRHFWHEVLDLPGAKNMSVLKSLLMSRPFLTARPDQNLLTKDFPDSLHIGILKSKTHAMLYIPRGQQVHLDLISLGFEKINAWWFDPRDGASLFIGEIEGNQEHTFFPPGTEVRGNDWVLVLDDASVEFPLPGR